MIYSVKSIGVIHTPHSEKESTPIQTARSQARGTVEVLPEYQAGLEGLEDFSHIILLYFLDRSPETAPLQVKPFLDDQVHGIFATRHPHRPNRIGLSVVRLIERRENLLTVEGVDILDGTPLLDIKPYVREFDIHPADRFGWFEHRSGK